MNRFIRITAAVLITLAVAAASLFLTYLVITRDCYLDADKLAGAGQKIVICDADGNQIANASLSGKQAGVSLNELGGDTVNAFIASEDRTFYKHNGLNYKRMLKALYKNLTSASFKEGASTISQQLVKNTHLSSDKTISRKLKEIKLTKKLEKSYTKDEILEMYLNTIYFGHSCYGLQSAAKFYFDKDAKDIDLNESAVLAGLLTSPNNYSPFKHPEKCLTRRNLVLKAMLDCGFISDSEYSRAYESPLTAVRSVNGASFSDYVGAVFDELEENGIDVYGLSDGCVINTYMDTELQRAVDNFDYPTDNAVIITHENGVAAYKSTIGGAKRQIGSTAKPIMVYAPAIDEKIVSPFTRILDEKVDFNGYSPENHDKQYHGFVSVAESLKNSYNVPAVKTLNALTIPKCEKYLKAMNITLEESEKNLSLALGGMAYGMSLKELADRYTIFSAGGAYTPSRFIRDVTDAKGNILYKNESGKSRVFSAGASSLINSMLIETSKSGTARRLKDRPYDVASKTGTCGNAEGNTDAYAISYTSAHTIGVWLGDKNNARSDITGGGDCCEYVSKILDFLYSERAPEKLDTTSGTTEINIDSEEYYSNNRVILADDASPLYNVLTVRTLKGCEPKEKSDKFSNPVIPTPEIIVDDGSVKIELCHAKYYSYIVKRGQNGNFETIYDGKWKEAITDTPESGYYTYTVTPYFENSGKRYLGKEIVLPSVNLTIENEAPQVKIPDIVNRDWFNM